MCAMPESSPADMLSAFQEIACRSLSRYDFSSKAKIAELSYSENITYLVEDIEIGRRAVLRVSRPGYHTRAELDAEALWVQSIRQDSVITVPLPIKGRTGTSFKR
ncbi:hypothetical protein QS257_20795 [Terrilactibacillus sp. S3-3]|nr:hypothetical protein QS257_20795 [Terrilactibacillus sp. S3-3]